MLAVRTLRPLPPEGPLTQPILGQLREPGLHVVHAPSGYIVSENVAHAFQPCNQKPVWLRLNWLDRHPQCLGESARGLLPPVSTRIAPEESPRAVGRVASDLADDETPVVVEADKDFLVSGAALEFGAGMTEQARNRSVVVVSHCRLPRHLIPVDAHVLGADELRLDSRGSGPLMLEAVRLLGVDPAAKLIRLSKGQAALVTDLVAAARVRDADLIADEILRCRTAGSLARSVALTSLRTSTPHERLALLMASELGYFDETLERTNGAQLRPWMIPLEGNWFWVRPLWKHLLRQHATSLSQWHPPTMSHTPGRSFATCAAPDREEMPGRREVATEAPQDSSAPAGGATQIVACSAAEEPWIDARLLGQFVFSIGGRRIVRWHGRIGQSVLQYLLMQPDLAAQRDALMTTFWPDVDPRRAKNRLHVALSGLRRNLREVADSDLLEFADGRYRMRQDVSLQIDVHEFESSAKAGRRAESAKDAISAIGAYDHAIAAYTGDFLSDSPYEEWTIVTRESLRLTYLDILERMARLLIRAGRYQESVPVGHLILAQDACSEEAHRLLMRAYGALDQRAQAIRQYELCARILKHELGTVPSRETVSILAELTAS